MSGSNFKFEPTWRLLFFSRKVSFFKIEPTRGADAKNYFIIFMPKFDFTAEQIAEWRDEPLFLTGTKNCGIILIHGWSSIPKQIKPLALFLHQQGYTVSIPMLKGHGTQPEDLEQATFQDWMEDVEQAVMNMKKQPGIEKVVIAGASMGGNLALLVSLKLPIDGLITIGTPVHLKNHLGTWCGTMLLSPFRKYIKKRYPKKVSQEKAALEATSYQYFPITSAKESLIAMRQSVFALHRVTAPILIIQTTSDYLIAKYSSWVIYNLVSSKIKKIYWVKSENSSHVVLHKADEMFGEIKLFIESL